MFSAIVLVLLCVWSHSRCAEHFGQSLHKPAEHWLLWTFYGELSDSMADSVRVTAVNVEGYKDSTPKDIVQQEGNKNLLHFQHPQLSEKQHLRLQQKNIAF